MESGLRFAPAAVVPRHLVRARTSRLNPEGFDPYRRTDSSGPLHRLNGATRTGDTRATVPFHEPATGKAQPMRLPDSWSYLWLSFKRSEDSVQRSGAAREVRDGAGSHRSTGLSRAVFAPSHKLRRGDGARWGDRLR